MYNRIFYGTVEDQGYSLLNFNPEEVSFLVFCFVFTWIINLLFCLSKHYVVLLKVKANFHIKLWCYWLNISRACVLSVSRNSGDYSELFKISSSDLCHVHKTTFMRWSKLKTCACKWSMFFLKPNDPHEYLGTRILSWLKNSHQVDIS